MDYTGNTVIEMNRYKTIKNLGRNAMHCPVCGGVLSFKEMPDGTDEAFCRKRGGCAFNTIGNAISFVHMSNDQIRETLRRR